MKTQRFLIRNIDTTDVLEIFFVSGISTVLIVRLFLKLTNYPQVGNDTWHIAHMLWGGLLMVLALLALLIFLDRIVIYLSALAGGIGFGLFIDEVGKFITQSNDYFVQIAVVIMYITFMLLFLVTRYITTARSFSQTEYLVNSLNSMKAIPTGSLSEEKKQLILFRLGLAGDDSILADGLKQLVEDTEVHTGINPGLYSRWRGRLTSIYRGIVAWRWFQPLIITVFIVSLLTSLGYVLGLLYSQGDLEDIDKLGSPDWIVLGAHGLSTLLILRGVLLLRKNRPEALQMFEYSTLVYIFIIAPFLFYINQFGATFGLLFNLLLLVSLRWLIKMDKNEAISKRLAESR
jgi:hypothetical protein